MNMLRVTTLSHARVTTQQSDPAQILGGLAANVERQLVREKGGGGYYLVFFWFWFVSSMEKETAGGRRASIWGGLSPITQRSRTLKLS